MKPRYRWIVATMLVSLLLLLAWGCPAPLTYSSLALEARVVDEATGQPLEGVIAVAHWQLRGGIHEDAVGELVVMEAVTDATGTFRFPAWGPKLRPLRSFLRLTRAPGLILFKRDYKDGSDPPWGGNVTMALAPSALPPPPWHGQTFTMKKVTGSLEEYVRYLGFLSTSLETVVRHGGNCVWKKTPRMLLALDQQEQLFEEKKIYSNLPLIEDLPDQDKCGSAREYFRSYQP